MYVCIYLSIYLKCKLKLYNVKHISGRQGARELAVTMSDLRSVLLSTYAVRAAKLEKVSSDYSSRNTIIFYVYYK